MALRSILATLISSRDSYFIHECNRGGRDGAPFRELLFAEADLNRPTIPVQAHCTIHRFPLHGTRQRRIGFVGAEVLNLDAVSHAERNLLVAARLEIIEIKLGRSGRASHRLTSLLIAVVRRPPWRSESRCGNRIEKLVVEVSFVDNSAYSGNRLEAGCRRQRFTLHSPQFGIDRRGPDHLRVQHRSVSVIVISGRSEALQQCACRRKRTR